MKRLLLALFTLVLSHSVLANYVGDNHPRWIDTNFNYQFEALPLNGELSSEKTPWASSFWPNIYGSIAFRWNNFYQGEPTFAPLHFRIQDMKKEIKDYQKELFSEETSVERRNAIIQDVLRLKRELADTERLKAQYHKRYFFDIRRPSNKLEVQNMLRKDRVKLSPAEKYDIWVGDYNLPLTKDALTMSKPNDEYWEGICHSWASASIEFHEPEAISLRNKDGIVVDFGSSDIKALLNYYHNAITVNLDAQSKYNIVGRVGIRCDTAFPEEAWFIGQDGNEYYKSIVNGRIQIYRVPDVCVDMNPGAFHVVMSNQISLKDQGFIADMVRDQEVWNQPVYKFSSKVLADTNTAIRTNATFGTVRQVTVETELHYANDGGRVYWGATEPEDEYYAWWDPTNGTNNFRSAHKTMKYHLDIDRKGNIIGGMWLTYDRPDFVWVKKSKGFAPISPNYGIINHMNQLKNLVKIRN